MSKAKYNNQFSIDAAKIRGDDTVGNTDRLILRYQFTPTDKPNETWTNTFKLVKKDDFIQVWITNGANRYAQYRLDKKQAKQLVEFLQCVAENS